MFFEEKFHNIYGNLSYLYFRNNICVLPLTEEQNTESNAAGQKLKRIVNMKWAQMITGNKIALRIYSIAFLTMIGCDTNSITQVTPPKPIRDIEITTVGSEESFDIATWNIEHFPKSSSYTIPYLRQIIQDIDIDLIAVQEIDHVTDFNSLLDSLDGYAGVLSHLPDYGLRLGIIYKKEFISITTPEQIFTDDDWNFPRPPLMSYVTITANPSTVFDFTLIIVHLKAFPDEESEGRRREACKKLKNYIDTQILTSSDKDVILLGDFNDDPEDPPEDNVFATFISDSSNYQILTPSSPGIYSYIGNYKSNIDHIIITDDVREEYTNGSTQILDIDSEFTDYVKYISDHRPVLAQFFVF